MYWFFCSLFATCAALWAQPAQEAEWIAHITRARAAKDSLLRTAPDSPLTEPMRARFAGLAYFPPNPACQLAGDLHIYGRRQQIMVLTNTGTKVAIERFGRLQAQWEGKPFWVEVYRSAENGELIVFFKDATNGQETYAGGRYVPLSPLGGGQYLIDFNMSYNPYCAYNADYICPMPPPQNYLPFAIRAGERGNGPDLAH